MPQQLRTLGDLIAALPAGQQPRLLAASPTDPLGPPRDDSRTVEGGDTFVAVPGETHDGHAFLAPALAAGAGLVIVEAARVPAGVLAPDQPQLQVNDSAAARALLAAGWHDWPGEHIELAGVTGTNGKTTTAHLLAAIFTAAGRPHLRLGTTGNWLVDREAKAAFTTPFPIELQALLAQARARGAELGVMEVSSHALAQGRAEPLRFRAAALTSFSQDHLDFHGTMPAYLAAKCRLAGAHLHREGVAVAPREQGEAADAFLRAAAEAGVARRWRCARTPDDQSELCVLELRPGPGIAARVRTPAGELELRSPLVGAFNLDNLLISVGLALGLGLDLEAIATGLARSHGAPGRLEQVTVPGVVGPAVYVDYAHTPDAVARALEALRPATVGALVVVLGCGGDRDASKRPLMGAVAGRLADRFVATSDNPRSEDPGAIVDQMLAGLRPPHADLIREVDRAAAIARAIAEAKADDVVLIAGKGHEDYQVLADRTIAFDDRQQAAAALRARA